MLGMRGRQSQRGQDTSGTWEAKSPVIFPRPLPVRGSKGCLPLPYFMRPFALRFASVEGGQPGIPSNHLQGSLRQSNAPPQVLEVWVAAQVVQLRVNRKPVDIP